MSATKLFSKKVAELDLHHTSTALQVRAYYKGKKLVNWRMGRKYKFYDMASLTKVLFTTTAFMQLADKNPGVLKLKISKVLSPSKYFSGFANWSNTNVSDLLSHRAGFPWWLPLAKEVPLKGTWQQKRVQLGAYLETLQVTSVGNTVYSDLDILLLGYVLEELTQKSLLELWTEMSKKLQLSNTHFQIDNKMKYQKNLYAPTYGFEDKCLSGQGLVNDLNCRSLGGVSTNSGLFSTMSDFERWALMWRESLRGQRGLCRPVTAQKFAQRQTSKNNGDFGLGFMLPSAGGSSSGSYFSKKSTGHTGFTGPSFWYDPKKDLLVLILTNRKNPGHKSKDYSLQRPLIHNAIVESLELT